MKKFLLLFLALALSLSLISCKSEEVETEENAIDLSYDEIEKEDTKDIEDDIEPLEEEEDFIEEEPIKEIETEEVFIEEEEKIEETEDETKNTVSLDIGNYYTYDIDGNLIDNCLEVIEEDNNIKFKLFDTYESELANKTADFGTVEVLGFYDLLINDTDYILNIEFYTTYAYIAAKYEIKDGNNIIKTGVMISTMNEEDASLKMLRVMTLGNYVDENSDITLVVSENNIKIKDTLTINMPIESAMIYAALFSPFTAVDNEGNTVYILVYLPSEMSSNLTISYSIEDEQGTNYFEVTHIK